MRPSFARIVAGVLISVLVVVIAVSAAVAVRMRNTTKQHELQVGRHIRELVLVEKLVASSERSGRAARSLLLTGNPDNEAELLASRDHIQGTLADLEDAAQSEPTRKLYERIRQQQDRVDAALDGTLQLRRTSADASSAMAALVTHLEPEREKMDALLATAIDLAESRLHDAREDGDASIAIAFRWLAVAIASALVLASLTATYLIRALRQLDRERATLEERVTERTRELQSANAQLKVIAAKDGLTGAWNRAAFDARLMDESARADRYGLPLALALVDIDHFKAINDQFGHQTGDEVIRRITEVLRESLRQTDYLARYGGEEFAIILVNTDREGAAQVAERIRRDVEGAEWPHAKVTVSVGVASWAPTLRSPEALLRRADDALYKSKRDGRNRVTYADAPLADA